MTNDGPHPGDEVLIRARVAPTEHSHPEQILVELFSKTDQYQAWVRRDLVEQVIPADQTRTLKGFTVAETRAAIAEVSTLIANRERVTASPPPVARLALDSLRASRDDLVAQLREIGVEAAE